MITEVVSVLLLVQCACSVPLSTGPGLQSKALQTSPAASAVRSGPVSQSGDAINGPSQSREAADAENREHYHAVTDRPQPSKGWLSLWRRILGEESPKNKENEVFTHRSKTIEQPELLDEDMKEILRLPDDLPPLLLEEDAAYQDKAIQSKAEAYRNYLERKRLMKYYATQVAYMKSAEWRKARANHLQRAHRGGPSRGIVISAGGSVLLNNTFATIQILRDNLGCKLPIEVVYAGVDEMDSIKRRFFEESFDSVRCIDSTTIAQPRHSRPAPRPDHKNGWHHNAAAGYVQKTFALCHATTFDEVLMIDGDSLPLVNPEQLFSSPVYQKHGSLFWPDFWDAILGNHPAKKAAPGYTLFGLEPPWQDDPASFAATETGEIMLNRLRHSDVLEWIWFLNTHHEVMYKAFWGDTGSFRLAFHLADKAFEFGEITVRPAAALDEPAHLPGQNPEEGLMERETGDVDLYMMFAGLVQHDEEGSPVFMHRTGNLKLVPLQKWIRRFKYFTVPLSTQRAYKLVNTDWLLKSEVDAKTLERCHSLKSSPGFISSSLIRDCGVDTSSTELPVEIISLSAFPMIAEIASAYENMFTQ